MASRGFYSRERGDQDRPDPDAHRVDAGSPRTQDSDLTPTATPPGLTGAPVPLRDQLTDQIKAEFEEAAELLDAEGVLAPRTLAHFD